MYGVGLCKNSQDSYKCKYKWITYLYHSKCLVLWTVTCIATIHANRQGKNISIIIFVCVCFLQHFYYYTNGLFLFTVIFLSEQVRSTLIDDVSRTLSFSLIAGQPLEVLRWRCHNLPWPCQESEISCALWVGGMAHCLSLVSHKDTSKS